MSFEEDLFQSVINTYKSRGLDAGAILSDPTFNSMKIQTRIAVLKKFANEINSTAKRSITKEDIKRILSEAVQSGLTATGFGIAGGLAAGKLYEGAKPYMPGVLLYSSIMGGVGAGLSFASNASNLYQNRYLNHALDRLAASPTTENAVNVLVSRDTRRPVSLPSMSSVLTNKALSQVTDQAVAGMTTKAKDLGQHNAMLDAKISGNPLKSEVTPEHAGSVFNQLKEKLGLS